MISEITQLFNKRLEIKILFFASLTIITFVLTFIYLYSLQITSSNIVIQISNYSKNPINKSTVDTAKSSLNNRNALLNIPKLIIQSVSVRDITNYKQRQSRESFQRVKNPGFEHRIYTNLEQSEWIRTNYPHIHSRYLNFAHDIQRCDFFRFLVIYHYGGFYFDS